jgi:hypothetical protein
MMFSAAELRAYVGRVREFERRDWVVYLGWVGLMLALFASTSGFLVYGALHGVVFPGEAWLIPIGAAIFALSIAVDTIGHRTIYYQAISGPEGLVHSVTIFCGIGSVVLLCAAHSYPGFFWIPAMILTVLSFVYSLVDEVFHWRRYVERQSDRVEMWSHVGILFGHGCMMLAWWAWFFGGYVGASETAALIGGG